MGITRGGVSHYEQKRAEPEYERLKKLAEILECSPLWLLFGRDEGQGGQPIKAMGYVDNGGMLVKSDDNLLKAPAILPMDLAARPWMMRAQVGPFLAGDTIYVVRPKAGQEGHKAWGRAATVEAAGLRVLARSVVPSGQNDRFHVYLFEGDFIPMVKAPTIRPVVATLTSLGAELIGPLN